MNFYSQIKKQLAAKLAHETEKYAFFTKISHFKKTYGKRSQPPRSIRKAVANTPKVLSFRILSALSLTTKIYIIIYITHVDVRARPHPIPTPKRVASVGR